MKPIDIGVTHRRDLHFAETRKHVLVEHVAVLPLRRRALLRQVFLDVTIGEILHGGGRPIGVDLTHRIFAPADSAFQFLRFFTCR